MISKGPSAEGPVQISDSLDRHILIKGKTDIDPRAALLSQCIVGRG